jgi:hypothetical protein
MLFFSCCTVCVATLFYHQVDALWFGFGESVSTPLSLSCCSTVSTWTLLFDVGLCQTRVSVPYHLVQYLPSPACVWLSEASVLQTLVFMFLGVLVKQNAHLLWRSASQRSLQINELGRSWACGARRIRGFCLAPTAAANPAQLTRGVYVSETAVHSLDPVSNLSPPPFILFQSC